MLQRRCFGGVGHLWGSRKVLSFGPRKGTGDRKILVLLMVVCNIVLLVNIVGDFGWWCGTAISKTLEN